MLATSRPYLCLAVFGLVLLPAQAASLLDNPAAFDPAARLYTGIDMRGFSDPLPLASLSDDDWGRQLRSQRGRERAQLDGRAQLAGEERGWHLSVFARRDGVAQASADTVRLARQIEQGQGFAAGQRYALDYRMDYWTSRGLRLGKALNFSLGEAGQLDLGLAAQYFKQVDIKIERFIGTAYSNASQQLQFSGVRETAGSLMRTDNPARFNPYMRDGKPSGRGYALDLGLRWQGRSGWGVELAGFDLAAKLKGRDMPRSYQQGSFLYDSDGDLIGNADGSPAVQGRDSRGELTLRPKASWQGELSWQQAAWQAGLGWQYRDQLHQARLSGRYKLDESVWLGLAFTPRTKLVELSAGGPWLSVYLGSSALDSTEAHALAAGLRFTLPLQTW
ncbi:hypothetical protein [Chitinimonas taiwanensis]|uniref:Alginate export domain-containing protein n=1 Tax=Chitinimonas taiwanensis DSM 18899 TaxID=1121279 RepID=A0A1K2HQL2_9NEIS|nr:hypothetical protein [Chitinimonas taiwanensis]SFZ79035.1 hypothetical protein SAMN02745887_03338 [Chitinimonas taiwanensis DSM 18899]